MFVSHNRQCNRPLGNRARYLGVSLIEVLVSIVIASLALLALAGVNASSVRYTKMSQYRATAALLANDIGERMRANKGNLASVPPAPAVAAAGFLAGAYDYEVAFSSQSTKAALPTAGTAAACDLKATSCTAAQIASLD